MVSRQAELPLEKVCKIFVPCSPAGGAFAPNDETADSGYFTLDALPELATGKNPTEQITLCFEACRAAHRTTQFD